MPVHGTTASLATNSSANPPPMINASTSSVRRNLFHAHLSRRPASSTSTSSTATTATMSYGGATAPSRPGSSRTTASRPASSRSQSRLAPSRSPDSLFTSGPSNKLPAIQQPPTSNEIVPIDPHTNLPVGLPQLPLLPSHLPYSHSQQSSSSADNHSVNPNGSQSDFLTADAHHHPTSDLYRESEDKARIEKSLVEMMYRARTKGRHHAGAGGFGYGTTLGPDMEEVMELLRESLKRKVHRLEEEGWMYGDEEVDTEFDAR